MIYELLIKKDTSEEEEKDNGKVKPLTRGNKSKIYNIQEIKENEIFMKNAKG